MDTWKISANSDGAVQDALSNFIVEVNMTLPTAKTNYFELYGINGSIDETEALGGVNYNDRKVTLFLITKTGINNPKSAVDSFINTYVGSKIRLHNITQGYMLIGRITDVEQTKTKADENYKLACTVVCDPLRYDTTYTPSASGLDIKPENLGANLWSAANVTPGYGGTHVTVSGVSIDADAEDVIMGSDYTVDDTIVGSGKLLRIYTQNINNCEVMIDEYDGENERIVVSGVKGTALYMSNGNHLVIRVFRKNTSSAASFGCTIREIATRTINNSGKSVPFELLRSFYSNVETNPSVYVNGTIFKPKQSDNWLEYAPAVLKSGENIVAAFVDTAEYDSALSGGEFKMRYRKGVL